MRRTFIEASAFTKKVEREGPGTLPLIQGELLDRPESGAVIPGTGGLRKLRVPDAGRGKGKRGGYRVIYLDVPELGRTYLLGLYGKGEKADLSHDEKKVLKGLVERLKREAR
jgi:mRNA-degrading endonuclease RelE of RelBE toxin-antitoxin system